MTTLITHKTLGGTTRRCDSRCYDAEGRRCRCICGGLNHGKGERRAIESTGRLLGELVAVDGVDVPILPREERENPEAGLKAYPLFESD